MQRPHQINRNEWDQRARAGSAYATPATAADFLNPLAVVDQCGWLGGSVAGRRLLCLAAGGGRHSALFAAAGARVTVVDLSPEVLALDRRVAAERGFNIRIVEASMDNLTALGDATFDIVVQPVSSCYVPDIHPVYREVSRVLVPGGLYISQHKQPASLQSGLAPGPQGYVVQHPIRRTEPLPGVPENTLHREAGMIEFLHRWEDLVGGLCRAGFVLEDLAEPRHADPLAAPGTAGHRACYLPPFVKLKARRIASSASTEVRLIPAR